MYENDDQDNDLTCAFPRGNIAGVIVDLNNKTVGNNKGEDPIWHHDNARAKRIKHSFPYSS
jgi:hypothetical protein